MPQFRPTTPQTKPNLPPKGWCFHRGAKLVKDQDPCGNPQLAVWVCSHCQNVASLHATQDAPQDTP